MNKPQKPLQALSIRLPRADRSIEAFHLSEPRKFPERAKGKLNRIAFAAATDRLINSNEVGQSTPMPRCAVSMASATPRPRSHR